MSDNFKTTTVVNVAILGAAAVVNVLADGEKWLSVFYVGCLVACYVLAARGRS